MKNLFYTIIFSLLSLNAYASNDNSRITADSTSGNNFNNSTLNYSSQSYSCGRQSSTTTSACTGNYNSGYVTTTTYTVCNSTTGAQQQYQTTSNNCSCNVPANTTFYGSCDSGYSGTVTYSRRYYCSNGTTTYQDTVIRNACYRDRINDSADADRQ